MLATIAYSLALAALSTTPAGPCDLLDRSAAGALLGAPVAKMDPSGPEPDEDTGATRTTCVYQAGQRMLIVIRLDFPNAGAARESTAAEMEPEKLSEEKATAKDASGLGDKAYLVYTPRAIQYLLVKGSTVLSLILGGVPNPLPTYEAQLRTDTAAALKKL
jgi:hypothetical protein